MAKFRNWLRKPFTIGFIGFLLGLFAYWAVSQVASHTKFSFHTDTYADTGKPFPNLADRGSDDGFFGSEDPFSTMRKFQAQMMKDFGDAGGGLSGSLLGGTESDLKVREDDKFVYYEIGAGEAVPQNVDVKVEQGQVTISGEMKERKELGGATTEMVSTFQRSFPAPEGVDADRVQVEYHDEKVVAKFPKKAGV